MMQGSLLDIKVTKEYAERALAGTRLSMKTIAKKTLAVIGRGALKAVKSGIRQTLQKRTGALLKTYVYKGNKAGTSGQVRVNPKIKNGDDTFRKVYALNYGYSGPVGRAHNFPHSFVQKGEEYLAGGSYIGEVQKMIDKELKKFWG